jgi:hypothetical protein
MYILYCIVIIQIMPLPVSKLKTLVLGIIASHNGTNFAPDF